MERISSERALELHAALQMGLSARTLRRRRSLSLKFLVGSCVVMGLWITYLGFSLPVSYRASQWKSAWVGFDTLLLVVLAGQCYFGWRRRQAVIPLFLIAATLLVCDAWFDIMLDWGTNNVWTSIGSAAVLELPLAGFFVTQAHRLSSMSLRLAWQRLEMQGNPPPLRRLPLFFAAGLNESGLARRAAEALSAMTAQAGETTTAGPDPDGGERVVVHDSSSSGPGERREPSAEPLIPAPQAAEMLKFLDELAADGGSHSAQAGRLAGLLRQRIAPA